MRTNRQTNADKNKNEANLVLANILTSGHWELSSIDISIQSHALGMEKRGEFIFLAV